MGRRGAGRTRRSRTSTRCRGCTRCSRATASGRPTSSRIRWPPIRAVADVLRALLAAATARSARIITRGRRRPFTPEDVARHAVRVDAAARSVRAAARQPDRGHHRGGRRARPCRTARAASGSPPITSPRSSGTATASNRASRRSSTRRTRAAPNSSRRRCGRTSSPTTTPPGRAPATCSRCRCRRH